MTFLLLISLLMLMKSLSPISISILILVISLTFTIPMYKTITSSWLPYVTILTFSSGMMTLFIYSSSICPMEKNKTKNLKTTITVGILATLPFWMNTTSYHSMKIFSSNQFVEVILMFLIVTMISTMENSFNPFQSLNSSF